MSRVKRCFRCHVEKPEDEFHRNNRNKDGRCGHCVSCEQARTTPQARRSRRLRRFSLTAAQWDALLAVQGGVCATCGSTSGGGRWGTFYVDHDHACCPGDYSCGICVRGLLCYACNYTLGLVSDDPAVLLNMVKYLAAAKASV